MKKKYELEQVSLHSTHQSIHRAVLLELGQLYLNKAGGGGIPHL